MSKFKEYIKKHFSFMNELGYKIQEDNNDNSFSFRKKKCKIDVLFNTIGYELTCQFSLDNGNYFLLQDVLMYEKIENFKGVYQVGDKSNLEKGIIYLSKVVKLILYKIDLSDMNNFQKVYQFRIDMRENLLKQYYIENDLKKAEDYWNKKKYKDAQEIFERHFNSLSKSQLKKLEYIKNHSQIFL